MKKLIFISLIFLNAFAFAQKSNALKNVKSETFDKINRIDKNGKKQGLWIIYGYRAFFFCNQSNYISSFGRYIDDFKDGVWNYYSPTGLLIKTETYNNDSTFVETKFYNNNQIKSNGVIEIKKTNDFDTIVITNPQTGKESRKIIRVYNNVQKGDWQYYLKDGTIAKKDEIELIKDED